MKYTDYIINGKVLDLESIIPSRRIYKFITIPILSTVALLGLFVLGGLLPMTITIDGTRYIRLQYIKIKRKYKVKYIIYIPIDKTIYALDKLIYIVHRDERFLRLKLIYLLNFIDSKNILFNFVRNDKNIQNKTTQRH